MTPEEKAKELVSKFTFYKIPEDTVKLPIAKQCALICVEETHRAELKVIENISEYLPVDIHTQAVISHKKYWQEVKQEIELL